MHGHLVDVQGEVKLAIDITIRVNDLTVKASNNDYCYIYWTKEIAQAYSADKSDLLLSSMQHSVIYTLFNIYFT